MNRSLNFFLIITAVLSILLSSCDTGVNPPSSGTSEETNTTGDSGSTYTGTALEEVVKSGTISSDETWVDGKVYYVKGDLTIESVVTIEPGCIVKIGDSKKITVRNSGKISARGTAAKSVLFTSVYDDIGGPTTTSTKKPEQSDWNGINIYSPGSVFEYCSFQYGDEALSVGSRNIYIIVEDCTFQKNWYGLCLDYTPDPMTVVERNRFFLNFTPLLIDPTLNLGATNMFSSEDGSLKNDRQRIAFKTWGGVQVNSNITFEETEIPFWGSMGIVISNNSTLTLASGVAIIMEPTTRIQIDSGSDLIMETGSVITSSLDTSLKGTTIVASSSYWDGIREGYNTSATYRTGLAGVYFATNN